MRLKPRNKQPDFARRSVARVELFWALLAVISIFSLLIRSYLNVQQ